MAFEEMKDQFTEVKENTKQYIDSSIAYYSLLCFKITAKAAVLLFKTIAFCLFFLLSLFLLSFAAAYAIGQHFENYALGFVIVGLFYFVASILIYIFSGKLFEKAIIKTLSELFYKD